MEHNFHPSTKDGYYSLKEWIPGHDSAIKSTGHSFCAKINVQHFKSDTIDVKYREHDLIVSGRKEGDESKDFYTHRYALPGPISEDEVDWWVEDGFLVIKAQDEDGPCDDALKSLDHIIRVPVHRCECGPTLPEMLNQLDKNHSHGVSDEP